MPNGAVIGKKWSFKYHRVLCMTVKGVKPDEIGKKVGLKAGYIRRIQGTAIFQEKRAKMERSLAEQVTSYFGKHAMSAAKKVVEISKTGALNQKMQFEASKEVLYQLGIKPVQVVENRTRDLTTEEVESSRKTVEELENSINRLDTTRSRYIITRAEATSEDIVQGPKEAILETPSPTEEHEQDEPVADGSTGPQVVSA